MDTLHALKAKLRFKTAVLASECDISTLPRYDMIFFLLTPNQIGHAFFIEAIEAVLHVRRNSKTLFFVIDDIFRLEEQELVKVTLELKASVQHLITNPAVYPVSSYYALLQHQYETGMTTLEDFRRNRDMIIPVAGDGAVTGRQLTEEHLRQLLPLSRMDKLYAVIERSSIGLRDTGIDTAKQNWLVTGPERTGKSLLTSMLQASVSLADSVHFADNGSIPNDALRYYDGVLIVLDPDFRQSVAYLEQVGSTYTGLNVVIVVNKLDTYMYFGMTQAMLQAAVLDGLRSLTGAPVVFVSAYYFEQYVKLSNEEVSLDDIIKNPQVILADSLHFPIAKEKHKAALSDLLLAQSGFKNLLHNWE